MKYLNGTISLKKIPDYNSNSLKLMFWFFVVNVGIEEIISGNQYTNRKYCLKRAKQLLIKIK